jgi:hypothetical protein
MFSTNLLLHLTASYFFSSNAVKIALYLGTSTAACSDQANQLGTATGFPGLCTAVNGMAITFASCSESRVTYVTYPDSSKEEKVNAPKCGKGNVKPYEVTKQCTLLEKQCFFDADCYAILLDSTCNAPTNVFLVSDRNYYKCSETTDQNFGLVNLEGNCVSNVFAGTSYIATVGTSENSINYNSFSDLKCNNSFAIASWSNVPANGVCVDAKNTTRSQSIKVELPVAFTYVPASIFSSSAVGSIIGGVIGTIIWCFGCWGILHACGCVNCPCFNTCCDRRKNIASSSSSTSFPTSSYGAQAPRSSPYGNARL